MEAIIWGLGFEGFGVTRVMWFVGNFGICRVGGSSIRPTIYRVM